MTWRRAALYWVVFLTLAASYAVQVREIPVPVAPPMRPAFLPIPVDEIDALDVRRGTSVVRCRRTAGRWAVTEPAERVVPSDLIAALVTSLTELADVEVVAEGGAALGEFGLQEPRSEITLRRAGHPPVSVQLGAPNPAGTAVYAQRTDSSRVFLIGLNVRYYQDLLFETIGQTQP